MLGWGQEMAHLRSLGCPSSVTLYYHLPTTLSIRSVFVLVGVTSSLTSLAGTWDLEGSGATSGSLPQGGALLSL